MKALSDWFLDLVAICALVVLFYIVMNNLWAAHKKKLNEKKLRRNQADRFKSQAE